MCKLPSGVVKYCKWWLRNEVKPNVGEREANRGFPLSSGICE